MGTKEQTAKPSENTRLSDRAPHRSGADVARIPPEAVAGFLSSPLQPDDPPDHPTGRPLRQEAILHMQRRYGNTHVRRMLLRRQATSRSDADERSGRISVQRTENRNSGFRQPSTALPQTSPLRTQPVLPTAKKTPGLSDTGARSATPEAAAPQGPEIDSPETAAPGPVVERGTTPATGVNESGIPKSVPSAGPGRNGARAAGTSAEAMPPAGPGLNTVLDAGWQTIEEHVQDPQGEVPELGQIANAGKTAASGRGASGSAPNNDASGRNGYRKICATIDRWPNKPRGSADLGGTSIDSAAASSSSGRDPLPRRDCAGFHAKSGDQRR